MDPSTPLTVAKGTLLTSSTTGVLAGAYGLFSGTPKVAPLVGSAAMNGGIAGATFFSFREYIASPSLLWALADTQYVRRIQELRERRAVGLHAGEKLTWWDMRLYKLPDTTVSGAFTGGVLNSWKRGPAGILPGMTTAGIVCAALQLLYNELDIVRIKYVSRKYQQEVVAKETPAAAPISPPRLLDPQLQPLSVPDAHTEPAPSFTERVLSAFGWHKVTDEDYLERLKYKRDTYLRRIAELERQVEREKEESQKSDK